MFIIIILCVKCAKEGDRIPPLESYGQPLEQEHRLSCVLGDCGGASANFLDYYYYYDYYYYHCLNYGKREEILPCRWSSQQS